MDACGTLRQGAGAGAGRRSGRGRLCRCRCSEALNKLAIRAHAHLSPFALHHEHASKQWAKFGTWWQVLRFDRSCWSISTAASAARACTMPRAAPGCRAKVSPLLRGWCFGACRQSTSSFSANIRRWLSCYPTIGAHAQARNRSPFARRHEHAFILLAGGEDRQRSLSP